MPALKDGKCLEPMSDYKVKLDIFEGPLDLLLHLIKEQELNIYDIPIAKITKQYFEYLDLMKHLNLEIAGEFLVMAASLTYIKSKMLLPSLTPDEEQDEGEDPRAELMRRLIEYKKYKEAAQEFRLLEEKQQSTYARSFLSEWDEDDADYLREISVFQLLGAFQKIMESIGPEKFYEIRLEEISVTEKVTAILEMLAHKPRQRFEDLFENKKSRMELIGSFLAILELIKQQLVRVFQEKPFGPIWVQSVDEVEMEPAGSVIQELDTTQRDKTNNKKEKG